MVVTTESGTRYVFDGRKVTRLLGNGSLEMVGEGQPMSYIYWGVPTIGESMTLLLDPKEYVEAGGPGYRAPMRTTSPVVSIQYDAD